MFFKALLLLSLVYTINSYTSNSSCNKYKLSQNLCVENKDSVSGEQCVYLQCNSFPEYACEPMRGCEPSSYASAICSKNANYNCYYSSNLDNSTVAEEEKYKTVN